MADIHVAELEITVQARQYPDAEDYWDGNWLIVSAGWISKDQNVSVSGPFLHLSELVAWLLELETLARTRSGTAKLLPTEPELLIEMKANPAGGAAGIAMLADPTPYRFDFAIDASAIGTLIGQIKSVLKRFPIKSRPNA